MKRSVGLWLLVFSLLSNMVFAQTASSFQKSLDSLNGIFSLEQSSDGTFWLGTFLGKIIRLDAQGNWIGAANLRMGDTAATRFVYDIQQAPGGGVWALYDRNNSNTALDDWLILARLNAQGQALWQSTIHYGEVLHWAHNRICADNDGNVYAMSLRSDLQGGGTNRIVLCKVSPYGTVLWSKYLKNDILNYPRAIHVLNDGSLLLCGNSSAPGSFGFLLHVSANGDLLWSRRFNHFLFKAMDEAPDGSWVLAATESGPLPQRTVVMKTDTNGAIVWAKRLEMPNALNWIPDVRILPSGDILVGNYETAAVADLPDLICLDPQGNLKWARRFDLCKSYGVSKLVPTIDGGMAGIRFRAGGHLLLKLDANGYCASCPSVDVSLALTDVGDQDQSIGWTIEPGVVYPPMSIQFEPFYTNVHDFCGMSAPTEGISMAKDTFCLFEPAQLQAIVNRPADAYAWSVPNAQPVATQGASVAVQWQVIGQAQVQLVSKFGFCIDTFRRQVWVDIGPQPFSLGADTLLCGQDAILLLDAAEAGAEAYQWSDGSLGPEKIVQEGGQYVVTASIGECALADTIEVGFLPVLPVNFPSDTIVCSGDTIWLDATAPGAQKYLWNDGSELPRRPVYASGIFAVTVYRENCVGSGFVSVDVFPRPPRLPLDTVVCKDIPLIVDVGESVAGAVRWNGMPGNAHFEFQDSGWLRRDIAYRGCYFSDSVYVRRVDCIEGFAAYAPNVFSPHSNLAGNRVFQIFGPDLEVLSLHIYDRWGGQVFRSDTAEPWGGSGGQAGVYIWQAHVRQNGRVGWIRGEVTLF